MPALLSPTHRRFWRSRRLATFAAQGLVALCWGWGAQAPAIAQEGRAGSLGVYGLQVGTARHASRVGIHWETAPWWGLPGDPRHGAWTAVTEFGVARWGAHGDLVPAAVWQLSATPIFRYWSVDRPGLFLEAGIGVSAFQHTHLAGDAISTAFQFGDHLGLGYQLSGHHRIGLRLSHYSNAGIKAPNPGLTLLQLTYTYLP